MDVSHNHIGDGGVYDLLLGGVNAGVEPGGAAALELCDNGITGWPHTTAMLAATLLAVPADGVLNRDGTDQRHGGGWRDVRDLRVGMAHNPLGDGQAVGCPIWLTDAAAWVAWVCACCSPRVAGCRRRAAAACASISAPQTAARTAPRPPLWAGAAAAAARATHWRCFSTLTASPVRASGGPSAWAISPVAPLRVPSPSACGTTRSMALLPPAVRGRHYRAAAVVRGRCRST